MRLADVVGVRDKSPKEVLRDAVQTLRGATSSGRQGHELVVLAAIGVVLALAIICIALGWHSLVGCGAGDLVSSDDKGERQQLTSHEENGELDQDQQLTEENEQLTKAANTSIVRAAGSPVRLRVVLDVQAIACEFVVEIDSTALESIVSLLQRLHRVRRAGVALFCGAPFPARRVLGAH